MKGRTGKTKLLVLLVACIFLISGMSIGCAKAEKPQEKKVETPKTWTLKYDYYSIQNTEPSIIDQWYFDEVAKRSNGRIKVEYYWSGALHKTGEHFAAVRDGLCELTFLNYGYYTAELPVSRGVEWKWRPGLESPDALFKSTNRLYEETPAWQKEYESNNIKVLYMTNWGNEACLFKTPVLSLDKLKGLKVRTYGVEGDVMKALGATPMPIAAPETYTSLERGIIDAVTSFGLRTAAGMKLHEIAPHVIDIGSGVQGPSAVVINKKLWDEFPQDIKDLFMQVRKELIDYKWAEIMNNTMETGVKTITEQGGKFHKWPDNVIKEAAKIAVPMQEKMWINDVTKLKLMTEAEAKDFLAKLDKYTSEFSKESKVLGVSETYEKLYGKK
ncbi:MAG: TRAP transporter substrate-binding protein DctP [Peptococcaceae bacterium]|jgi:TRAP-type C4-dicarboxylate transport system substrate-binding protein|nr:TRAP transporter substrate-binding protein DctP [Peptococcaceae bacterium]MDH7525017.1 TRAP transporter substrate-binding protein DctP [Peptococcaceae bacterium]